MEEQHGARGPLESLESLADEQDFEFERRFLVTHLPEQLRDAPTLIIQSYFLADAGYALRVRVQASGVEAHLGAHSRPLEVLEQFQDRLSLATVTLKGPAVGGTRYESERHVDVAVATEVVRRGGAAMVKTRYSVWSGADGWAVDVFGGANHPLIIAECERTGPVTDLEIPGWCLTELTDDRRFSNESLAGRPYGEWAAPYLAELAAAGPQMRGDFGTNAHQPPT